MSDAPAQVLLITSDRRLRDTVQMHRPPEIGLCWATPAEAQAQPLPTARELWLDLDDVPEPPACDVTRRVYFHSRKRAPPGTLPSGSFIRKPCSETVAQVLWAGVQRGVAPPPPRVPDAPRCLPAWALEFHELGLRTLCRKCVHNLGPRLGYADVSMYLHNLDDGVLTLAEKVHARSIDRCVPLRAADTHLMVAVARSGKLLVTSHARQEWTARQLRMPSHRASYSDGRCLIAPLMSGGRLWGVLNFSHHRPAPTTEVGVPFELVFAFIGRCLRYARAYDRARTQARVDPLTGLYNQRWMAEAIAKEIPRARRTSAPLSVIVADVDGLKAVNDRAGHPAGDWLLRHVAGRITSALRQSDSAARLGGDEFVILLPGTDLEGARNVAQRVLESIRNEAARFRGITLPIRASLGVAQWQLSWGAAQLLEAADHALYQAKARGRDQLACDPCRKTPEPGMLDDGSLRAAPVTTARDVATQSAPQAPETPARASAALFR